MKVSTIENATHTMGIDMGDRHSHFAIMDNVTGKVVETGKLWSADIAFREEFGKRKPMQVAIEVGTHSPWASRLLEELGHEVQVANPRKLRMIYQSDKKNDKVDAEMLARVARFDAKLLAPIRHRGLEAQTHLAVLRARNMLVQSRTQLINHVRGAVKSIGGRVPSSSSDAFPRLAKHVPKALWAALAPLIDHIAALSSSIRKFDQEIERLSRKEYPETKLVSQINGVGPVTSLTYVLTLEDPSRFKTSRQVGAYLGLRPRQDQSGTIDRQLRITKAGDSMLRKLVVQCAHYILGPFGKDCDLRRWGLQLMKRGGKNAKKRAVVAVARKVAVLMHRLWVSGTRYEPLYNAQRRNEAPTPA